MVQSGADGLATTADVMGRPQDRTPHRGHRGRRLSDARTQLGTCRAPPDLNRINCHPAMEPVAPTSGIGGAPLPKGGSFLNHGPSRSACSVVAQVTTYLFLKSYADLPASGRNSGHRWTVSKVFVG